MAYPGGSRSVCPLPSAVLAALLLALAPCQDLAALERTLERAVDKATYEDGAYAAAQQLASLGGVEAMALRLRLFDDKLDTYRGVYLRDWFYSGMQRWSSPEEAELLVAAAADKRASELKRVLALRALAAGEGVVAAKPLLASSLRKAPDAVRREWQHSLGALLAADRLDLAGVRGKDPRGEVLDALAAAPALTGLAQVPGLEPARIAQLVEGARKAKDPGDFAALLRALVRRGDVSRSYLVGLVQQGLEDDAPAARLAALHAAARGRVYEAAPLLVEALGEAEGRFVRATGDALAELTGQKLGWSARTWKRWWDDRGGEWLRAARAGELDPAPGANEEADEAEAPSVAVMFGIPVDSRRLVVVVDGSGSMRMDKLGERSCAEAAAAELDFFLGQLADDARFEVVVIGDAPLPVFEKLVPASARNRAAAVEALREHDFGGTSALYDVLVHAQRLDEVDTLLLISDGGGSSGSHQYGGHMLEGLKREYERTGVRIHGICVGKDGAKVRFMRDLAAATGGIMVQPSGS